MIGALPAPLAPGNGDACRVASIVNASMLFLRLTGGDTCRQVVTPNLIALSGKKQVYKNTIVNNTIVPPGYV